MSDRLTELQRQRALAAEQLAWFDREIAKETGQTPTPAAVSALPVATPGAPVPRVPVAPAPDLSAAASRTAEEILSRYQQPAGDMATETKKGCYLYFIFFMGLLVIFAVGAYFIYTRTR